MTVDNFEIDGELQARLRSLGLNDNEIETFVYIASNPHCKVRDIQRGTGLVRTTIYYGLNQLRADGLISENVQNNVRTYRVNDGDALKKRLERTMGEAETKLKQLDGLSQMITSLSATDSDESFVSRFEGVDAIKSAIDKALRCDSRQWCIIAARDNFLAHMPKQYQEHYLQERERRGIRAKTLWEQVPGSTYSPSMKDLFFRSPRRLPDSFTGQFSSLTIMYDDTVLIIDDYDKKTAHAITDGRTAHLMRLMFGVIWDVSSKL